MTVEARNPVPESRGDVAALRGLLVLSSRMLSCDSQDEVLRLALTAFPSVSTLRPLGVYLEQKHAGRPPSYLAWFGPADPIAQLHALAGSDGRLADGVGERWNYAASMRSTRGLLGYLVVSANDVPGPAERFFLGALAQQTAAAVAAARQRAARPFGPPSVAVNVPGGQLFAAESLRRWRASELMTDAVLRGGVEEMARAASALTRMPVAIVDQFGHLQTRAAEGPERVEWNHVSTPSFQDLNAAATAGKSIRLRQTLIAAAVDGRDVLGGVLMTDAAGTADPFVVYVVERSAVLLGGELAHRRELARLQTRLRGDFVLELLNGVDNEEAFRRAALLGHDLQLPHRVVVIRGDALAHPGIESALRSAIRPPARPLVGCRPDLVVALVPDELDGHEIHAALKRIRPHKNSSIGVGGKVVHPSQSGRSYTEALRALRVRERSEVPDGVTSFADLGLYQILEERERGGAVDEFIQRWLGPLIGYDSQRQAGLVNTLAHFLDCGGNYDQTARSLLIHRSTLRYRLRRIRDVAGIDMADVDTRLNLHVATRAWRVLELH
jgi:sugar diacid utilization regulator